MTKFLKTLPLELTDHRGKKYKVKLPLQSGGKAGKGHNKTSTIQVMYEDSMVVKQIRFIVRDHEGKMKAIRKAIEYVIGKAKAREYFTEETDPVAVYKSRPPVDVYVSVENTGVDREV